MVNTDKAPRQIQLFEITICLYWHGNSHHRNNYYVTNDVFDLMTVCDLTHSRRDLLNVLIFEYLQLGYVLGIMSVKEF